MVKKRIARFWLFLNCLLLVFVGCGENKRNSQFPQKKDSAKVETQKNEPVSKNESITLLSYFSESDVLKARTDSIISKMSDEELAGQMIIASYGELGRSKEQILKLIKGKKIGGAVILKGDASQLKQQIEALNIFAKNEGALPLLFSCDAEPSLFNSKLRGTPDVLNASDINTLKSAGETALTISKFLRENRFNQNYAPVCDFDLNREIIGNRSFGHETRKVTELALEFVRISQLEGIVATAKHFPGHGTVKGDSHSSIVYIDGELRELEVFRSIIEKGVISVMVGHIAIKNNKDYDTDGLPSTMSGKIVTDLLRTNLGFNGIIITDAMNMGAVTSFTTPSMRAVKAGCDLILMPTNEEALHSSILEFMKNAQSRDQVVNSVKRIIRLKICLGLI